MDFPLTHFLATALYPSFNILRPDVSRYFPVRFLTLCPSAMHIIISVFISNLLQAHFLALQNISVFRTLSNKYVATVLTVFSRQLFLQIFDKVLIKYTIAERWIHIYWNPHLFQTPFSLPQTHRRYYLKQYYMKKLWIANSGEPQFIQIPNFIVKTIRKGMRCFKICYIMRYCFFQV